MLNSLEEFYFGFEEPQQSIFLFLRSHLLADDDVHEEYKWRLPYFTYKDKGFAYFWIEKKTGMPYIGMVKGKELIHPALEQGDRKSMKILRLDPHSDLPMQLIDQILEEAKALY